jgi:hypothetical protein
MDEAIGRLLSILPRPHGRASTFATPIVGHAREELMDDRGPIDRPFLVFVVIATIAVLALCIAVYPQR